MMIAHTSAPVPPSLEGLRQASARWVRRERARVRVASGVEALDRLLGGGWPQGKVGELIGPACSGRSAAAAAAVAAATARGEVTAWLDAADAYDPASAAAAGVDLGRVLWVRPRDAGEAVRAAELVLETGGFTVVVLDLGSAVLNAGAGRTPARGRERGVLRQRLARAVERAGAVALVLTERPWAGTLAGATVALARGEARWEGPARLGGGPRWLTGLVLRAQVERGAARGSDAVVRQEPPTNLVILRSGAIGAATKDLPEPADDRTAALPGNPSLAPPRAGLAQDDIGGGSPADPSLSSPGARPRPAEEPAVETAVGA